MNIMELKEISSEKSNLSRLEDISKNLALSVSLASGLAWKDKVKSFYQVIASNLLDIANNKILDTELSKISNGYYRVKIDNEVICFNKSNMFLLEEEKIDFNMFFEQKLLYLENQELPMFLTSSEKNYVTKGKDEDIIRLLNRNYNRQELNSDRYFLTLVNEDKDKLLEVLINSNYFAITVRQYLELIATGKYDYDIENIEDSSIKTFKSIYNNYILELGAYFAKVIDSYIDDNK